MKKVKEVKLELEEEKKHDLEVPRADCIQKETAKEGDDTLA